MRGFYFSRFSTGPLSIVAGAILFLLLALWLPNRLAPPMTALSGETMGTRYSVLIPRSLSPERTRTLQSEVSARLSELENTFSAMSEESELSRLNARPAGQPMEISRDMFTVLAHSLLVARRTNGAFDPTVAPLVELWGFGKKKAPESVPGDKAIARARKRVGYAGVDLYRPPPRVVKKHPDMRFTLAGVAKGYAVDELSRLLSEKGLDNHMVEIGGEVRVLGYRHPEEKRPWQIGIESPAPVRAEDQPVIRATEAAVATSGGYRNYYEINGTRYSHTLNPRTGRPVRHDLSGITVVAEDVMAADTLATALMVMGPQDGMDYAQKRDIPVLMYVREKNGKAPQKRMSSGMKALLGAFREVEPDAP